MKKALRALFFGTPEFSVPVLKILNEHEFIDIVHVITPPDKKSGRGQQIVSPPVAQFAKDNNLSLFQTQNINKESDFLEKLNDIDIIFVIAFSQFLSSKILNIPRLGCFNIHTSLLPKYRGAAPIQYALLNGDSITGVSIQKMVKKMDAGDIVFEKHVSIEPSDTSLSLFNKLSLESSNCIAPFIDLILNDKVTYKKQDEDQATFAPTISKDDGYLKFSDLTFEKFNNTIRAFHPWPGTFFFLNNLRIKVFEIEKSSKNLAPGELDTSHGLLEVGLIDQSIRLASVQLEGKKRSSDQEVLNGLKNKHSHFSITEQLS